MYVKTNIGKIQIKNVDESTRQKAKETVNSPLGDWQEGEELVLAELEGFGWKWVTVKDIKQ